jgi:ABC-type transport system involved in cytochrome bd biosynthesis fused ATPase/permease subunit
MDVELGNGDGKGYSSVPPAPRESVFRGRRRLGLKWSNMNFSLKTKSKRRILQDCWGAVEGGQLCAILGPSGSGEWSFLSCSSLHECMRVSQVFVHFNTW